MRKTIIHATAWLLWVLATQIRIEAQCYSRLVYPGDNGMLVYVPDEQGNTIPDFSNVGYMGGVADIPNVPIRATVNPGSGDDGARIQAAIDRVSQMPPDASGLRGAVLLTRGEYRIGGFIEIKAGGVVLRGEGKWESSGTATVLRATGTNRRALIQIKGSGARQKVAGTEHNIIDKYVPVGAISFTVDSADGLSVGDTVIVHRPSPAGWIHDINMDRLSNPWTAGSKNIDWDRVIVDITDNQITLDAPITTALEQRYGGGTIYKYTWPGRIENVGIENMKGKSDYRSATDENHSWDFISLDSVQNGWVRDVASQYFAYSLSNIHKSAKWITVANSDGLDPKSQITGGRRYSFNVDGQLNLVINCRAREGRHDYVMGSVVAGPNAFVNSRAENAHADAGPHHRWSSGGLFDNITTNNELNARNRGNSGTGHGWSGANMVIWNSRAAGFIVESPQTAQNWLIGSVGALRTNRMAVGPVNPAIRDSHGCPVEPQSLYHAQLADRLAYGGVATREYRLGDVDNFTNDGAADHPYVDPAWWNAVASATNRPLIGFDDATPQSTVPFTFQFDLQPGETVVGATLTLALRAVGSGADSSRIFLDVLDKGYGYSDLGWEPLSAIETGVRMIDLTRRLDLLQDGKLDVALESDTAVDWALLRVQVAPVARN